MSETKEEVAGFPMNYILYGALFFILLMFIIAINSGITFSGFLTDIAKKLAETFGL